MKHLKRMVAVLLALCLLFCSALSAAAEGEEPEIMIEESDYQVANGIYNHSSTENGDGIQATGLIVDHAVQLVKSGGNLIIYGYTYGSLDVEKIGFTYVKLQRLESGVWTDYRTYLDQFTTDDTNYDFGKSISADHGYTYRVICEHYAEKTLFLWFKSTQSIYNETTTISF